jgi:manganese oxidase
MPYSPTVGGVVALNYRAEPLAPRRAREAATSRLFLNAVHGDAATPLLQAFVGDGVRLHVLASSNEQGHVISVEGHRWPVEPGRAGAALRESQQMGALAALTLVLEGGAGGSDRLPGDYLYGDHREPYRDAGLWGIFRVYPTGAAAPIRPLTP